MQFCHRVPASPLDSFIESIWVYHNDPRAHALERILRTGTAQLIVNLKEDQTRLYDPEPPYRCVSTSGSVLSGMQTRFQVIDTSEQVCSGRIVQAVFPRRPSTTSIARVTDTIGLSAKRFIERFKREVGVTPKRYCRIRRFQRVLRLSHHDRPVDWTQVAIDCGYFDQAHFIHDFRSFAGITPTVYQSARTSFQNTSNFYNPPQTAFETMTPWLIQKTHTAQLRRISWYPTRTPSSIS